VGPTADGRIPVIQQQRLADIGDWLKVNGEAIYGSSALKSGAWTGPEGVKFTRRGAETFVICTKWPDDPLVVKGDIPGRIVSVRMLGCDQKIRWDLEDKALSIHLPVLTPASVPCSHAWVFAVRTDAF
jgi:alpha-L-fucosidase